METKKIIIRTHIAEIKKYLGEDKWEKVFELIENIQADLDTSIYDKFISIKSTYYDIEEKIVKNTIEPDDIQIEISKATERILILLNTIETDYQKKKKSKNIYGIIGIVLSLIIIFSQLLPSSATANTSDDKARTSYTGNWILDFEYQNCNENFTSSNFRLTLVQFGSDLLGRGESASNEKGDIIFEGKKEVDNIITSKISTPSFDGNNISKSITLKAKGEQYQYEGAIDNNSNKCKEIITLHKP